MTAKFAIDTNILIYAEALSTNPSQPRSVMAARLVAMLAGAGRMVIPAQVFGELVAVLERKTGLSRVDAVATARLWRDQAKVAPTDTATVDAALALSSRHGLTIWDALVVAASAEAGCSLLLTEDMHDGFVWRGCTLANPFAAVRHPLLVSLLE